MVDRYNTACKPTVPDMSPKIFVFLVSAFLVKDASYTDAAPTNGQSEMTVLPRTLVELMDSEAFDRVWRNAAAEQMSVRFGDESEAPLTRNMIGDYIVSDEFHQAVCKGGNQGMTSMGGMMSSAPAPMSYMGTFIGSEKFQHGTCDMMSQGMIQFGTGMNGWFRSSGNVDADTVQDPTEAIDTFFRSEYYKNTKKQLRDMFSDVQF